MMKLFLIQQLYSNQVIVLCVWFWVVFNDTQCSYFEFKCYITLNVLLFSTLLALLLMTFFRPDDAEHQCWSSVPVDVDGLVQEALPRLDSASRMHAARVMTMAGVQSVADLQYLKEEDFNCVLRIVHRRRLVHYFKRKC